MHRPVTVDSRLDVLGAITVTADEMLQEVSSSGQFQVRGFAGSLEAFRVRLPPGMRLRETPEPGYQVRVVPPEEAESASAQVVEVRLDQRDEWRGVDSPDGRCSDRVG